MLVAEGQLHWDNNTWNHLTVYEQMSSSVFENRITNGLLAYNIYIYTHTHIHIYTCIYIYI